MGIYDAACKTIASAGHRRGAQMGVLRVDHPDIEEFIRAKQNSTNLTAFNVSVAITDEFMHAVLERRMFTLRFNDEERGQVYAPALWEQIMRSTWEWAEPGVIFIDRINECNNLWYCEDIAATNPCGEQPLPPNGACLLGSFNLVKYVHDDSFDWHMFMSDVAPVVRAMDMVIDVATYPLERQELEARRKRRMGLGITGLANAGEILGMSYGSPEFLQFTRDVLVALRDYSYAASSKLAAEKGSFPLFQADKYLAQGTFASTLPPYIQESIRKHGIRNSHLTSIAPTGTISISADNVSSGIEPVFSIRYDRTIQTETGERVVPVIDYAKRMYDMNGKTAMECTADDHLNVLLEAQKYVDSACSKTCNVSPEMPWEDFKSIYIKAWRGGAKGCTTFNPGGKRFGILKAPDEPEAKEPLACYIDEKTGERSCE
jgi:ribonucleoside-diphosphate reductase alpha chain